MSSHSEASSLAVPVRRTFGRKVRLLSMFSEQYLTVLNDRIFRETEESGECRIAVDYNISFDTNTASFLRGLFAQRAHSNIDDLRKFIEAFRGNKLTWDVLPYLQENAESLLVGKDEREIFETILASKQLHDLDAAAFVSKGTIRTKSPLEQLQAEAQNERADFLSNLSSRGWIDEFRSSRAPIYASVLCMACLERASPGRKQAARKLKQLIEFMDAECSALYLAILWMAWRWFDGDGRTKAFHVLQRGGPEPIKKASNISWDLYHMLMQYGKVATSRKDADILIPAFLTADQPLAELWKVYPVRSCWAQVGVGHPFCAPDVEVERDLPSSIKKDVGFVRDYLTLEAHTRRVERIRRQGRPCLAGVIQRLEHQLHASA